MKKAHIRNRNFSRQNIILPIQIKLSKNTSHFDVGGYKLLSPTVGYQNTKESFYFAREVGGEVSGAGEASATAGCVGSRLRFTRV